MHSVVVAVWIMALANLIAAGFWAAQFTLTLKWRKSDNNRNELLARAQLDAQNLSNEAMRHQISLFQTQAEIAKLDLASQKISAAPVVVAEAQKSPSILNWKSPVEQQSTT